MRIDDSDTWFYADLDAKNGRVGPIGRDELRDLAKRGVITYNTPLYSPTISNQWFPAYTVEGLFQEAPGEGVAGDPNSPAHRRERGSWSRWNMGPQLEHVNSVSGWSIIVSDIVTMIAPFLIAGGVIGMSAGVTFSAVLVMVAGLVVYVVQKARLFYNGAKLMKNSGLPEFQAAEPILVTVLAFIPFAQLYSYFLLFWLFPDKYESYKAEFDEWQAPVLSGGVLKAFFVSMCLSYVLPFMLVVAFILFWVAIVEFAKILNYFSSRMDELGL